MKILIKQARIIDDQCKFNGQIKDILIEDGVIRAIENTIQEKADETIQHKNLHVSIGWFDLRARFCDPGFEHKETIESGLNLAEVGGFTGVGLVSNTHPSISSKSQVEYFMGKSAMSAVEIVPLGTVTENREGLQLAEMYDMQQAGAKAFCDDGPLSSGILYRALLYGNNFNAVIFDLANDPTLSGKGQINEGKYSVMTGLKGIPKIAETIRVKRDIELLKYTEGKLHLTSITSLESIQEIESYRKKHSNLTSDVSIQHLLFTDAALEGFDSNLKVFPPFRTEKDKEALKMGVLSGAIDCICSDHNPQDKESKDLEFDMAEFGIIGIETFFATIMSVFSEKELGNVINSFTKNPRNVLGLNIPEIKVKENANLTLFVPDLKWEYTKENNKSLSLNSPLLNTQLKGKAIAVINKGQLSVQE